MANSEQLGFNVVVKDFSGHSYMIAVNPSLNVAQLKQEISRRSRHPASNFKIVFAGMKLKDEQTLAVSRVARLSPRYKLCTLVSQDFGLTSCSTLHCVRERPGNIEVIEDPSTSLPNKDLLHLPGVIRGKKTCVVVRIM